MVKSKLILPVLIASALVFAAQPVSAAAPERVSADLSIRVDMTPRKAAARGTFEYQGKLRSEKRACENFRTVSLFRTPEGGGKPVVLGDYETPGNGKWSILVFANSDGTYFATTPRVNLPSGTICKRARSKDLIRDVMP
jgi:hypothetical protein